MASLILTVAGSAIGGPVGALIGGFIGTSIDSAIFAPSFRNEGPRLSDLNVQASSYGQPIPRIWGSENRIAGNVIWSTGLIEEEDVDTQGGKGGSTTTTTYTYHVDCAIALCRGPIVGVKRIWADGKLFRDLDGVQQQADAIRIYTGSETQNPDPTIQAAEGADSTPAYRGLAYVVFENLQLGDFGNRIPNFTFEVEAQSSATVAAVIDELCAAAGVQWLDAARTDYFDLRGYAVSQPSTIRELLEPLRTAFFFDMSEIDGELQFFPIDSSPIAKVPASELGAHTFGTDRPANFETRRTADIELPRQVTVQHFDPARDYQPNSQRARRSTLNSDADISIDLPIVISASEDKAIAERMLSEAWLGRTIFRTSLPIDYLHVEPGNKIVVQLDDAKERTFRVKRKELRLHSSILLECRTDGSEVLARTTSASEAPVPGQEVLLPGITVAHLLDLPILRDIDDNSGFYVAGNGASEGWRGAVLYRSRDGGTNYDPLIDLASGAVIGTTDDALAEAAPEYWDNASTVTITLLASNDTLESKTELEVLAGANGCVIGNEVVQFRDAELLTPGQYRLSGLLRGRKGTEDAIAGHDAGDRFVLLSGALGIYRPEIALDEIGIERHYKASSVGTLLADATSQLFTHTGRWAKPYTVEHVEGVRDSSGNLSFSWIRRTRFDAPWMDGVDAPLGENSEAYEIDVLDGSDVVRTITSGVASASYSAAEQTADFGSAQASISMTIYQLSSRVGRGLPKEVTL